MTNTISEIDFAPIKADELIAIHRMGLPPADVARLASLTTATGTINRAGYFDPHPNGERFIAFHELRDIIFWHPTSGRVATLARRSFALNEDHIDNAATYAFDCNLNVFPGVLDWLIGGGDGIVVLDWSKAFDRLRCVPRIAIDERILPTYRKWMQPPRMPRVFVIPIAGRKAA